MIGVIIAKIRKERGWTQKELAEATGLSRSRIAAIEEGGHPGIKTMAMIADALGVEVKELYKKKK
ncbi:helix-turn-helix domain-containing protein [Desulfosporosinus hippei]|uniref:DNA-binding transcriptional regulator, XRE-family HTH domain n=1 Tax=Desulfosporosinus hippei DSM 8344 TaxID=1121419 RepID=A0A1G7UHN6_9FIRM|nr:helix-turn-helix transcriptional regulator [Desulfosporosinus hippei]SDG46997.1 DNA-binding transcriptional regulator, XRE-family HTH domain [Desulfosporosinus hippei DSM 8344]